VVERQPTLWQHPVDAGQPGSSDVSAGRRPRVCSVRADSDGNTAVEVLCARSGWAGRYRLRSWTGVQCRARNYCADNHVGCAVS
jgi:hypothetical protein